jgi:hypothetical protein
VLGACPRGPAAEAAGVVRRATLVTTPRVAIRGSVRRAQNLSGGRTQWRRLRGVRRGGIAALLAPPWDARLAVSRGLEQREV